MEFTGKWACPEYLDAQLNVMPDGTVYVTYSERGEYSVRAQAKITEDKLTWSACGITGTVVRSEDGYFLEGACTENGKNEPMRFRYNKEAPEALPYHHAPQGEPVPLPEGFPVPLSSLVGRWKSDVPYGVEMNLFDREGRLVLSGHTDQSVLWITDTTPLTAWEYREERYGVLSQVAVRRRSSDCTQWVNEDAFLEEGGCARRVITVPNTMSSAAMRYSAGYQLRAARSGRVKLTVT
ncbi:MAG: hypothetical protein IJV76_04830, partial [Clostridia bacterium]|nr:hypothetical protein [Clostridia bacterium]